MNKTSYCIILWLALTASGIAQSSETKTPAAEVPSAAGTDETSRLMQEYMARRAEWVAVRKEALDKVKAAGSDAAKKQIKDKLANDEKPLRAKVDEAARAYRAAEKAKRDQNEQAKPRG